MKSEFFGQILEHTQISNFMKIRPTGDELFRATRQTDMTYIQMNQPNKEKARKTLSQGSYT